MQQGASHNESFLNGRVILHCGDCREILKTLADNSIDSVVCDPPYALVSIQKRFGRPGSAPVRVGNINASNDLKAAYARASAGFMGKQWDNGDTAFDPEFWREVWRVVKPGGHLVAFSGTRTYHRMVCAIEDAGFEVRDQIGWAFGSGFPKSHDVSKGIDKKRDDREDILRVTSFMADAADAAGLSRTDVDEYMGTSDMGGWWLSRLLHRCQCPKWDQWLQLKVLLSLSDEMDREVARLNGRKGEAGEAWQSAKVIGTGKSAIADPQEKDRYTVGASKSVEFDLRAANSDSAIQWQGWGTALKPAWEPICLARKPLSEKTVAANVLRWGTGAINVDGCRVGTADDLNGGRYSDNKQGDDGNTYGSGINLRSASDYSQPPGRWPANIIHDGSEEVIAAFPDRDGATSNGRNGVNEIYGGGWGKQEQEPGYGDTGSAARFFKACSYTDEDLRWAKRQHGDLSIREANDGSAFGAKAEAANSIINLKTDGYGNASTDQSRPDSTSTTSIMTPPTIEPTISLLSNAVSTTHIINACAKPTGPNQTEALTDSVSDVPNGNRSTSFIPERPGHSTATVNHASEATSQSGERKTESTGTPTIETTDASAKRFHYTSKADASDRIGSVHPTVKPIDLMQWLCRLVTPKGGTVLDPFAGTGTTAEAAFREGFNCILMEREEEYQDDIRRRMALMLTGPNERAIESIKAKIKDKPVDHGPLFGWVPP